MSRPLHPVPEDPSAGRTDPAGAVSGPGNPARLLHRVLDAQTPGGAFPSIVLLDRRSGRREPDENAFVTALVLHHLMALPAGLVEAAGAPTGSAVAAAIERGLDFLEGCRVTGGPAVRPDRWGRDVAGTFRFYPEGSRPEWMQIRLAPDVDDTVLCVGVLLEAGRLGRPEALDLVGRALEPHRLHDRTAAARWPWVETGAYKTWLCPKARPNPPDCTVNANAAALLARLGLRDHPAYRAAVRTVLRGVEWAGGSPVHGRLITPYYPDLAELARALDRACAAGVDELAELQSPVCGSPPEGSRVDRPRSRYRERPICSSADGRVHWLAPVLQTIREIADRAGALPVHPVSINRSTWRGTLS